MFYANFVKLCNSVGKSPSAVAEAIGVKRSTVTRWKQGRSVTDANLQKVADYFGVTVLDLTAEDENKKSPAPEGAELTPDQIRAIEKIKNMPPEELARKMAALEAVLDM